MKYIVYKISNLVNNKIYFGVTQQKLKIRWQQHKCNSNKKSYHLYNAMKKYGFEKFNIEIVFEANSKKEMLEKEIQLIALFNTNNRLYGYNNSTGGEYSRKGCKLTLEQRKIISEYQKNRIRKPLSQETKEKIGIKNKGLIRSDELKRKWSISRKGKPSKNKRKVILNKNEIYESIKEASLKTGIGITSISNNLKGLSKKTKIGIWEYYQTN
jgi:group I intron endonuclease